MGWKCPATINFTGCLLDWTLEARPGIKILLFEPFVLECGVVTPEWTVEINQRREVVRKIAADYKLPLILTQEILNDAVQSAQAEYWLRDGVHPTLAGHQLLADAWLKTAAEQKFFA